MDEADLADTPKLALTRPDVVLIRPRDLGAVPPGAPVQDPLGVGFLAAVLRSRGHDVAIVDAHALDLEDNGVVACVAQLRPAVVGLSLHSFSDYAHCVTISEELARNPARPYCVWGGEHATFHAEDILLQHSGVDAVVLGEGEDTFCEIVQRIIALRRCLPEHAWDDGKSLRAASSIPLGGIVGAVVRDDAGGLIHGGFRAAIDDLDALPNPHKDSVEIALRAGKSVSISILTGRMHSPMYVLHCSRVHAPWWGRVWRRRSPRSVVDEVEALVTTYMKHPLVHPVLQFQDVIFLGTSSASQRWIGDFLDEMERRHLRVPFYCMARADESWPTSTPLAG